MMGITATASPQCIMACWSFQMSIPYLQVATQEVQSTCSIYVTWGGYARYSYLLDNFPDYF